MMKKWEWDERNGKEKKLKAPTIIFYWRCLLLYFINVSKLKHLIALAPLKSLKMRSVIFVNVFLFFQLVPLPPPSLGTKGNGKCIPYSLYGLNSNITLRLIFSRDFSQTEKVKWNYKTTENGNTEAHL